MKLRTADWRSTAVLAMALVVGYGRGLVAQDSDWQEVATGGPSARCLHAMAYDSARQVTVLFGGMGPSYCADTWEWNGTAWTQRFPIHHPDTSDWGWLMAYDSARERLVLYALGKTWEWVDGDWVDRGVSGPGKRYYSAMAYDSVRGRCVLFGGYNGGFLGDTWEWDGSTWEQRATGGPAARRGHALAFDNTRGRVILFGGYNGSTHYGETWEWLGSSWNQIATSGPTSWRFHGMACDSSRNKVVLFGGQSDSTDLDETWEWDGTSWTQSTPLHSPTARRAFGMGYDITRARVVLFGGGQGSAYLGDTWELGPTSSAICLLPGELANTCNEGEDAPNQVFDVWNCGGVGTTLDYTITDDADWLWCEPSDGSSTGEHDTITVHYSTASLACGTYPATITISDPAASNDPRTIPVTLTVTGPSSICYSPSPIEVTCTDISPCTFDFQVWNCGCDSLAFTVSDNAAWLTCTPETGTSTGPSDPVTVTCTATGLTLGQHSATIMITAPGADNSPQAIPVMVDIHDCAWAWEELDGGLSDGNPIVLGTYNDELIVGGQFISAVGVPPNCIARWSAAGRWQPLGTGMDTSGYVCALTVYNHELIAGGHFTSAGGVPCSNIARWNGTSWAPLGSGMGDGNVSVLTVYNGELIAGGAFTTAGGVACTRIARWNGSSWAPLGSGLSGAPGAMTVYNDELIVGGTFTTAGGVTCSRIARWSAAGGWQPLGAGLSGGDLYVGVHGLAVYDNELIAGGGFTTAGGEACNYIARWNGSTWQSVGGGTNSVVFSLSVFADELIAGGAFSVAGGVPCVLIARWSAAGGWQPLASGTNGSVNDLCVYGNELIASGDFSIAGGTAETNRIARWGCFHAPLICQSSATLVNVSSQGENAAPQTFEVWNCGAGGTTMTYVITDDADWLECDPPGGSSDGKQDVITIYYNTWDFAPGTYSAQITITDAQAINDPQTAVVSLKVIAPRTCESEWQVLSSSVVDGVVDALNIYDGELIAGGSFTSAGGGTRNSIASWNGGIWSSLGSGMAGGWYSRPYIEALAVYNNELIAGGNFDSAGGVSCKSIARWDGWSWRPLGSGTDGWVYALTVYDEELIVAGDFDFELTEEDWVYYIARWNGATWDSVGSTWGMSDPVHALTVFNENLIAGGVFTDIHGSPYYRIAQWDGSTWQPIGSGMNNGVYALAVNNNELVAGGDFTTAGGVACNRIARWNGSTWQPMGSGMNGRVSALAVFNDELIAAGSFSVAGGILCNGIARWDGIEWRPIGDGVSGNLAALGSYNNQLVVGGAFSSAGDILANNIACVWPCQVHQAGDYSSIQAALNAAHDGDTVELADQTFIGSGNRNLDFGGKRVTLRSTSDNPAACIIDCLGIARGFNFHSGETTGTVLKGLTIKNGHADQGGGIYCSGASPKIVNCILSNNSATSEGGGIYGEWSSPVLSNCLITGNSAILGAGLCGYDSDPTLTNCVFSGNTASSNGGGLWLGTSSPTLTNCILWGNTPQQVYVFSGTPQITYSDVQGGWTGEGNLNADPLWVHPDSGDFHLTASSPCVDAGDNTAYGLVGTDLGGGARVAHCRVDLGVYESPYFVDCNENGTGDACDIDAGTSLDANGDGVPDECEVPEICREPGVLTATCAVGHDADSQDFEVLNCGGAGTTLNYTITDDADAGAPYDWLTCNPTAGDSTGEHDTITVTYNAAALPLGTFLATITISDNAGQAAPQTVSVTLNVTGPPSICHDASPGIEATCGEGEVCEFTFQIWNCGEGVLDFEVVDDQDWLTCNPLSGESTGPSDAVTITCQAPGLIYGEHTATITITDEDADNSPQEIPVSVYLTCVGQFLIGGAIYEDCTDVFGSAVNEVLVTVQGEGGTFTALTGHEYQTPQGPQSGPGVWGIPDVPCGQYTVTPLLSAYSFCLITPPCPPQPDPCYASFEIMVDEAHEQGNGNIMFLAVPPVLGACCFADGTCQNLTGAACLNADGFWEGPDTACGQAGICTGACCLNEGLLCLELTGSYCGVLSGDWQGFDTDCTDADQNGKADDCDIEPGDLNCDGQVNSNDVEPFVLALTNPAEYGSQYPDCTSANGDMNGDQAVDGRDVQAFVDALLAP